MALFELAQVMVHRDGRAILQIPELSIETGFLAVVGPNGAGKTTLLKLLAGLESDYQGEVRFRGVEINRLERVAYARQVQYVFQQPIFLTGSVQYNLQQPLSWHGLWQEKQALLKRLLLELELGDKLAQPANTLSGGEAQRLGLLRSLLFSPEVLLVDEPTANVDAALAALIARQLRQLADDGCALLVSTHDQELIKVSDKMISLNHGELTR